MQVPPALRSAPPASGGNVSRFTFHVSLLRVSASRSSNFHQPVSRAYHIHSSPSLLSPLLSSEKLSLQDYIPGRTDNAIKNHWNSSLKRKHHSMLEDLTLESPQPPLKKSLSIGEGQNLGIPYRSELSNFGFDRFPPFCLYLHIAPFGRILPFSICTYNNRSICIFESI